MPHSKQEDRKKLKTTILVRYLLAAIMMVASTAKADSIIKYGANASKENEPLGSTKSIFVSDQGDIVGPFIRQYEIGGWFDNSGISGRHSSALLGASAGVGVNAQLFFAQALVGPSLISHPDSSLGGYFQFNNDYAFGLRDPNTRATIGFNYKHVSSAGIELPNRGRDFLMFRVSVPF